VLWINGVSESADLEDNPCQLTPSAQWEVVMQMPMLISKTDMDLVLCHVICVPTVLLTQPFVQNWLEKLPNTENDIDQGILTANRYNERDQTKEAQQSHNITDGNQLATREST
jgi:hypothetical protein